MEMGGTILVMEFDMKKNIKNNHVLNQIIKGAKVSYELQNKFVQLIYWIPKIFP